MAVPHTFPALLDADAEASVLLVGAGMSAGIAPSVLDLANDVNARHNEVVAKLGVNPSPPPTSANDFYDWAERAFNGLKAQLNLGDDAAKVRLANSIGVTTDPRSVVSDTFHNKISWLPDGVVSCIGAMPVSN